MDLLKKTLKKVFYPFSDNVYPEDNQMTIAMSAHYPNYIEQFKKWFIEYSKNFDIRINLFTNLPEEFKNFKYENLFIYSVNDLIPNESIEKELLLNNFVPYGKFPWNARRHIIRKSFDLGYSKVLYLENDMYFLLNQEKLEQVINLTESNTIYTTQSIWCNSEGHGGMLQDQETVGWVREFNKLHNLNVNTEGFCAYDAPDIFYNFTKETYKSYFDWWDKAVVFNDTYSITHNSARIWIFLNALHKIPTKRYPIENITPPSHFLRANHDPSVHYESPLRGQKAWESFFK